MSTLVIHTDPMTSVPRLRSALSAREGSVGNMPDSARAPERIAEAERVLSGFESIWRTRYEDAGPRIEVAEGEKVAERFEVGQFAFGLMASIMRTTRALSLLADAGFAVESRAMFRSLLDQALALEVLKPHGVHAVHAFGLEHKFNFEQLLKASQDGFPLGKADLEYISKFIAMAEALPKSPALSRAQNAIKTSSIGRQQGTWEKYLYQMWLEATPLSKPSMKLADAYSAPEVTSEGLRIRAILDSDSDGVVDPRLVLQLVVPNALLAFAQAIRDEVLASKVRAAILELSLPVELRMEGG